MLVLVGKQGTGKSRACSIIGGDWFSDSLPPVHSGDKDVALHLLGIMLAEIAELASFSRAEAAMVKSFTSRQDDRIRVPYEKYPVSHLRRCVFMGTTNEYTFLRDATGGRRFWPVEVGNIDTEALARDRDQLFAEAAALYQQGVPWWPDAEFEAEHMRPAQEARYESDVWEGSIAAFLKDRSRTYIQEIAQKVLFLDLAKIGTAEQRRISAALERLGWQRGKRTADIRWWEAPKTGEV